jgi:FtsP/CotA-like multicopper oxidase with cupredoxin domain
MKRPRRDVWAKLHVGPRAPSVASIPAILATIEPLVPRVTIAFRPDDRPGQWMYHCHILEHHAAGMMGHFEVVR